MHKESRKLDAILHKYEILPYKAMMIVRDNRIDWNYYFYTSNILYSRNYSVSNKNILNIKNCYIA